jgi:hypothetical protein
VIRFFDIEPNNIEQALVYYRQCVDDGTWSADKAQALCHKQDDPDPLIRAIAEVNAAAGDTVGAP